MKINPTPYPEVNEIVNFLLRDVRDILGEQFVGTYLHGSLANGGFDEHSDIDIMIVTDGSISQDRFDALYKMHEMISVIDSPWRNQLEVSYFPKDALRRFDRSNNQHPHLDRGTGEKLRIEPHGSDWVIQRHITRERGITVAGPDPKTLIDPVSRNDLRAAVAEGLPLWLNPVIENPGEMSTRGYQSFFVLSLCRMLYTLQHGQILSKAEAAEWAKTNLDPRWQPLIERALTGRRRSNLEPDPQDVAETLEMMRYTLAQIQPTFYPEVYAVLHRLLASVKAILADRFVGMYLYGSLASGDFDPETSDLDFVVLTEEALAEDKISRLEAMHRDVWGSNLKWAARLEGAYVPKELIRRHDPNGTSCPTLNEGQFYLAPLGSDWIIQRHIVREFGVVVEGSDPKALIDFVSAEDLRQAVKDILQEWWFPMLEDPSWLRSRSQQYHAYAVLSMCRALYALEYGIIISKPIAAKWAKQKLGGRWSKVIDQALLAQNPQSASVALLEDAIDLIRYAKGYVHKYSG